MKILDGIVLVGHSYGGMVIIDVVEQLRNRISAIVYPDAFLPADGKSLFDIVHTSTLAILSAFREDCAHISLSNGG